MRLLYNRSLSTHPNPSLKKGGGKGVGTLKAYARIVCVLLGLGQNGNMLAVSTLFTATPKRSAPIRFPAGIRVNPRAILPHHISRIPLPDSFFRFTRHASRSSPPAVTLA